MKTKIGIPKALLYHRYKTLWKTFFERLDCEIVESSDTTKETIDRAFTYNVIDMIEKPFPEKTLLEKVRRVLE